MLGCGRAAGCAAETQSSAHKALPRAGYGTSETLLLLGASTALDKFKRSSKVLVGTDFKARPSWLSAGLEALSRASSCSQPLSLQVVALTDLGLGSAEDAGSMAAAGDAVSISLADGVIVDWSVVGASLVSTAGQ